MNKNKMVAVAAMAALIVLGSGCVTAGVVTVGYDTAQLCTVCDGTGLVAHTYGTTTCTHCDGTGYEPYETAVVNTVIVDTWCPTPPPPRPHRVHRHAPAGNHRRPPAVHRPQPKAKPAARAAKPAGGGARRGGGARQGGGNRRK